MVAGLSIKHWVFDPKSLTTVPGIHFSNLTFHSLSLEVLALHIVHFNSVLVSTGKEKCH